MCEMFGVCTAHPVRCNELLDEFFSHAIRHPDGWGLADLGDRRHPQVYRDSEAAHHSTFIRDYLARPLERDLLLAHIRHATAGQVCMSNTHPFVMTDRSGRRWTLAHNGTIFTSQLLEPFRAAQRGSSDSERILCALIAALNRRIDRCGRPLPARRRFAILARLVQRICPPHNVVNLLICDGELLYIHTNRVGRMHMAACGGGLIVATQPLTAQGWHSVPLNTLLAYRRGQLVLQGRPHPHVFDEGQDYQALLRRCHPRPGRRDSRAA